MNVIELKDIYFRYPEGTAVFEGLNFVLPEGARVGLMGLNGSGKTTLFFLIMGLLKPQQGQVLIWGKERRTEADFHEVRQRIGYLFQDPDDQLFSPTVEEDIAFGPLNLKHKLPTVLQTVERVCDELKIAHLKQRVCFKLSWGQKRLVSLAGLLAMSPEVLIFDEPTASIDREVVQRITGYLKASQQTLLIASHDEPFLFDLCPDIYVLEGSRFIKHTPRQESR
jgi:cobalt/nickel transport system ATP-binding protein